MTAYGMPLLREANELLAQLVDERAAHAKTCSNFDEYVDAATERTRRLSRKLASVRKLHSPCRPSCRTCHECFVDQPCPTLRALDGSGVSG